MKESNVKFTYRKKSDPTTEENANPDASANPDADAIPKKKNEQTIDRLSKKNIGLLSKSQLDKKLRKITGLSDKKGPKRNRNGKQGIDKSNGYKMNPDAPRKQCYNCGNSNHLALDCRKQMRKKTEIPSSDKGGRSVNLSLLILVAIVAVNGILFMFVLPIIVCIRIITNLCPNFIRVQIVIKIKFLKFISKLILLLSQLLMDQILTV